MALVDSQYHMVIRGVALKNMFSRVGLTTAVQWPNLRNVQTDKVSTSTRLRYLVGYIKGHISGLALIG